jgi:hypothetical protein
MIVRVENALHFANALDGGLQALLTLLASNVLRWGGGGIRYAEFAVEGHKKGTVNFEEVHGYRIPAHCSKRTRPCA